jgi:glycosyltransferase involved in cell wall biosynthesis
MKILLVTPMPPRASAPGAIPLVLHAQLTGLSRRHEVVLATVAGPDPAELEAVELLVSSGTEVHHVERRLPGGLAALPRRRRLAASWLRGSYPWRTVWFAESGLQPLLDELLARDRFDVVAVEDNSMAAYRFGTRAPLVLTEHEVRQPRAVDWRLGRPAEWPRGVLREADWARWPRYQRRVWLKYDLLQVFTRRDADSARRLVPELNGRVRVTPFGIDLPPAQSSADEDPQRILFVGNFTHTPNVDAAHHLVKEVLPQLRARVPDVRLAIVGAQPPADVRALAGDGVNVLDDVEKVDPHLAEAALVLAPVRIGGGMRMKVLQAMAFGKAVVTTERGVEGLNLGGAPVPAVVADGADATAEAAAELLGDQERRHSLGERARRFVEEHFSPDAYARRLESVYAEAIEARRDGPA